MNKNLALFFDVDGTIFKNKTILPSTYNILKELSMNDNIDIYLSTGRSIHTIDEVNSVLPFFTGMNLANGGQVFIKDKTYVNTIDESIVKDIANYMIDNDIPFGVVGSNKNYRYVTSVEIEERLNAFIKCDYERINKEDTFWYNEVIEFWILCSNDLLEVIKKKFTNLNIFFWGSFGADAVALGQDKATGIKKIVELMDYDINNTIAFGDSDNDIPMFNYVKTSIAMGSASSDVKSHATFVTDIVEDDGLAKAVYKYVYKKDV